MPKGDQRTDSELIDAARAGEVAAFEALYYRYRDWVVRLAFRLTGNRDDALDALQDTFTYLVRRLPGLYLSARLTTFLYPVVRHCAIEVARKARRHQRRKELADQTGTECMPPSVSSREDLAAALRSLPAEQCETLLMRYVDDMSLPEIAAALGIPLGTVKSRIHNALQTLRQDERVHRYFKS